MAAQPSRLNIYDAVAANRWRTVALVTVFTGLLVALGYVVGEVFAPGGGIAVGRFRYGLVLRRGQARARAEPGA